MIRAKHFSPLFLIGFLIGCIPTAELNSGKKDLSYLDDADTLLLKFDYSDLTIQGYGSEEHFIKALENSDKKPVYEQKEGKELWQDIKKKTVEKGFEGIFKDYLEGSGLVASRQADEPAFTGQVVMDRFDLGFSKGLYDVSETNWEKDGEVGVQGDPEVVDGKMRVLDDAEGEELTKLNVEGAKGSDARSVRNRLYGAAATFARSFGQYFEEHFEQEG